MVADLDGAAAESRGAGAAAGRFPGRAIGAAVDVRDDASLDALFRRAVLEFGGLDCLFYTAGLPPRFAPDHRDPAGGPAAAARGPLPRRGRRDRPGRRDHAAPGARRRRSWRRCRRRRWCRARRPWPTAGARPRCSRRSGWRRSSWARDGIRVNAINADQVDTPLFRQFVRERAASRGVTEEEQLEVYRSAEPDGRGAHPGGGGGGPGGAAGEREVPVHDGRHHHGGWRPARGFPR